MPLNAPSAPSAPQQQPETIKDTLISIMIAFTMAFVFRGFVVEAFVIPTGSMAPTLMGAHMQLRGPETGYQWITRVLSAQDSCRKLCWRLLTHSIHDPG